MRHVKIILIPNSRKFCNKFRGLNSNLISSELESEFKTSLRYIVNEVSKKRNYLSLCGMKEHIFRIAGYNMNFEKNPSGIIMLHSYTNLETTGPLSPKAKHRAFVLAWAIEMANTKKIKTICNDQGDEIARRCTKEEYENDRHCRLVGPTLVMTLIPLYLELHCLHINARDWTSTTEMHSYNFILEGSKTKHEEPTPSSIETVPNDASMLRSFIYGMLEDNFEGKLHKDLLQLYNYAFLYTAAGNYLDNYTTNKGKTIKYSNFDWKTYEMLNEYKTAYKTFKLPLFVAALLTQKSDNVLHDQYHKIGSDLNILFLMQEEYEDCFGNQSKTYRSAGTNIQNGKCTWLAVSALQRCTSAQRIVFNACYGSNEPAHVERIKLLYEQLKLPQMYREEESTFCESIMQRAESIEYAGVPLALFNKLLDAMCR